MPVLFWEDYQLFNLTPLHIVPQINSAIDLIQLIYFVVGTDCNFIFFWIDDTLLSAQIVILYFSELMILTRSCYIIIITRIRIMTSTVQYSNIGTSNIIQYVVIHYIIKLDKIKCEVRYWNCWTARI